MLVALTCPRIFQAKQAAPDRIRGDLRDALRPAAGITKDHLLAAGNKFFCHILDAQMLLVIKLWQTEAQRAWSCLAESWNASVYS